MTPDTALESLKALARARGIRVRGCSVFDPNVEGVLSSEARFTHAGMRFVVRASASRFSIDARIETGMVFSIGAPNRVLPDEQSAQTWQAAGCDVYVASYFDSRQPQAWLSKPGLAALVRHVDLARGEAIHVMGNGVNAVLHAGRRLDDELFDRLVALSLALRVGKPEEETPDVASLPPALGRVVLDWWRLAESDDDRREEVTESMATAERSAFLQRLTPHVTDIHQYLDSLAQPWPDAAIKLGALAELTSELQRERTLADERQD